MAGEDSTLLIHRGDPRDCVHLTPPKIPPTLLFQRFSPALVARFAGRFVKLAAGATRRTSAAFEYSV